MEKKTRRNRFRILRSSGGSSRRIHENAPWDWQRWAGNPNSRWNASRRLHLTATGYLRTLKQKSPLFHPLLPVGFTLPFFHQPWPSRADLKSVAKDGPPHFARYYLAPRVIPFGFTFASDLFIFPFSPHFPALFCFSFTSFYRPLHCIFFYEVDFIHGMFLWFLTVLTVCFYRQNLTFSFIYGNYWWLIIYF